MALAFRNLLRPAGCRLLAASGFSRRHAAMMVNGKSLDIIDPGESMLDLMIRNGLPIRWECKKGECGACSVEVSYEGERHSVLACQEKPVDGMRLFASSLVESVCAGLKDAKGLADNIIRYLEYRMRAPQMAEEEARADALLREHGERFDGKLTGKKLKQLLRGEHIHLDKADLNDLEALVIARTVVNRNRDLRLLDLNGNTGIGDVGAGFISDFLLGTDHELRSLFLSNCGITDAGAGKISQALRKNEDLMILELRKNSLTDAAATELAAALASHPELGFLYLQGNQIGDSGALSLALAVSELALKGRKVKVYMTENPGVSAEMRDRIQSLAPKHSIRL